MIKLLTNLGIGIYLQLREEMLFQVVFENIDTYTGLYIFRYTIQHVYPLVGRASMGHIKTPVGQIK